MIVAYATQAGRTAEDGSGRNSPYTTAFLKHIQAEEEIGTVFRRIGAEVYDDTGHAQLPELSLSLIGEFYLPGKPPATPVVAPDSQSVQTDPCASAEAHWKSADMIGTKAGFEDHLSRFTNCAFAGLARAKLAGLTPRLRLLSECRPQMLSIPPVLGSGRLRFRTTGASHGGSGTFAPVARTASAAKDRAR